MPGFVQPEDPKQADHAKDATEARAHARGTTRARDRTRGPAVERGRRRAAAAEINCLGSDAAVAEREKISVVVALGETGGRHELGYIHEEGHRGHGIEPKEKSEGVVALGDAREHHLQGEEKEARIDNVDKDPVVFLRESHEPDVVAEEGPQRHCGHEERESGSIYERSDPALVHRRGVRVESESIRRMHH